MSRWGCCAAQREEVSRALRGAAEAFGVVGFRATGAQATVSSLAGRVLRMVSSSLWRETALLWTSRVSVEEEEAFGAEAEGAAVAALGVASLIARVATAEAVK